MSKKQKILLAIFLAMFIVPEILWSPIINTIYELGQSGTTVPVRDNFLMESDNLIYFRIVNFIQLAGIFLVFLLLLRTENKKIMNWFILGIILLLFLMNLAVFYLSFALADIGF